MLKISLRTLLIYVILSVLFRLMGKRQIGELQISELVSTLLLSELAVMSISDTSIPVMHSIVSILIIVGLELLTSDIKNRLPFFKRIFEGKPSVLISRGKLDQEELRRMRISVEELLSAFRLEGIASIDDVYYAILEQNGKLSVIQRRECHPLTLYDLPDKKKSVQTPDPGIVHALVVDGAINKTELSICNKDMAWLQEVEKERSCAVKDMFLLALDDADRMTLIKKEEKKAKQS